MLCGLLITLVMTWLASLDNNVDDKIVSPVTIARKERDSAAQLSTLQRGSGTAGDFLNSVWPQRVWIHGPVPDVFTGKVTTQAPHGTDSKSASDAGDTPAPTIESKFSFKYAGKLQDGGSVKIFFESAAHEVIQLRTGESFGVDWQLKTVMTDHLVIEHKPSGKLFHLQTGS